MSDDLKKSSTGRLVRTSTGRLVYCPAYNTDPCAALCYPDIAWVLGVVSTSLYSISGNIISIPAGNILFFAFVYTTCVYYTRSTSDYKWRWTNSGDTYATTSSAFECPPVSASNWAVESGDPNDIPLAGIPCAYSPPTGTPATIKFTGWYNVFIGTSGLPGAITATPTYTLWDGTMAYTSGTTWTVAAPRSILMADGNYLNCDLTNEVLYYDESLGVLYIGLHTYLLPACSGIWYGTLYAATINTGTDAFTQVPWQISLGLP